LTVQRRRSASTTSRSSMFLDEAQPYVAPEWVQKGPVVLTETPKNGKLTLASLPTPLYQLYPSSLSTKTRRNQELLLSALPALSDLNINLFVKRDDSSGGVELGGNKIRKLEFLLAEAVAQDCDSVITIGGEQSNHCRATAAAATMLGMEPHLILRTEKASYEPSENELGLVGNVLFDRMVGSQIYTCTPGEYGRIGSEELVARLARHLQSNGKNPYSIPVGGSNGLGSWGYINGVAEMLEQWKAVGKSSLDHVVFSCGSGGTAAGIALGISLAYAANGEDKKMPTVHAIGVCDDPDYFYDYVAKIADEMGFRHINKDNINETTEEFLRRHMVVHQGKGLGYAISTQEELDFVMNFARGSGIVLDPVYSGKALYQFMTQVVQENPADFQGKNVLFWHTGGALGLFEKVDSLSESIASISPCERLDVYGKGRGVNLAEEE